MRSNGGNLNDVQSEHQHQHQHQHQQQQHLQQQHDQQHDECLQLTDDNHKLTQQSNNKLFQGGSKEASRNEKKIAKSLKKKSQAIAGVANNGNCSGGGGGGGVSDDFNRKHHKHKKRKKHKKHHHRKQGADVIESSKLVLNTTNTTTIATTSSSSPPLTATMANYLSGKRDFSLLTMDDGDVGLGNGVEEMDDALQSQAKRQPHPTIIKEELSINNNCIKVKTENIDDMEDESQSNMMSEMSDETKVEQTVDSKNSKGSKIAAFLPDRQIWGWHGVSYRKAGVKGRARKQFYKTIKRNKESITVGDCAVFLSTGRADRPYIGRIESMWETTSSNKVVRVKWFYHPEETTGCPKLKYPGGLFESPHEDENDVQTISHRCEVFPFQTYFSNHGPDFKQYLSIYDNNDTYFLAGNYNPRLKALSLYPDIPIEENQNSTNETE